MSDTNRLGIQITATSTAQATVGQLAQTVQQLEGLLRQVGGTAQDVGGKITSSINSEIAAINKEITARGQQKAAIQAVTAAIKEQGEAAAVVHRSLQQNVNASFGVSNDRQLLSAKANSQALATSLSAAAVADAYRRDEALLATAALEKQASATRLLAQIEADRAAAFYANRDLNLSASGTRLNANYENRDRDLAQDKLRREAEYENAQRNAAAKTAAGSAEGIIASANPGAAAARASAAAIVAGANEARAAKAGAEAAEAAIKRQALAYKAVEAAAKAAAAAGASEAEITIAGARAAALALATQSRAGGRGGGGGLNNEIKHAVAGIDELASGRKGAFFGTLGAAARDAGLGVGALSASMVGLVAILGTSAILRGAENLGKWATETRAAASAAGTSIQQYSALSASLKLIGLSGSEADTSLHRLAESLSTALADPASKTAEAFHNLQITQEQLEANGQDTAGALRLLADAFVRTQDGGNKTANLAELLGRGFERLIPLLQNGGTGLDTMTAKAKELGLTLDEQTAAKLEATGNKVRELSGELEGRGIAAMVAWSGAIVAAADGLKSLIGALSSVLNGAGQVDEFLTKWTTIRFNFTGDKSKGPVLSFGPGAYERAQDDNKPAATPSAPQEATGPKASVPPLTTPISQDAQRGLQLAQAEEAASRGATSAQAARIAELKAGINVIQQYVAADKAGSKQMIDDQTKLANVQKELHTAELSSGASATKQSYADFASGEKEKIAEAQGSAAKIIAIYDDWISKANGMYKQHASVILAIEREKVQEINKARLAEIEEGAKREEQGNKLSGYDNQLRQFSQPNYRFSNQDSSASSLRAKSASDIAEAQLVQTSAEKQIASLQQVARTADQGSETQKKAQEDIIQILLQSKGQEVALYRAAGEAAEAAAKKAAEAFTSFFSSLGSSFDSFQSSLVKALIAPQEDLVKRGLTSVKLNEGGTEIRKAIGSLLLSGVNDAAKSVEHALTSLLANSLSVGATDSISTLLGNWLKSAFSSVAGNAVGGAAGNAIGSAAGNVAGGAASNVGGSILSSTTASTTLQTAGVSLNTAGGALNTAAAALTTAASTQGAAGVAGGVAGGGAAGASGITQPIVTAITSNTATTASSAIQGATSINTAASSNTNLLISVWQAISEAWDVLLSALNAKPSLLGFTYSQGGIVPSARGGMVVGGVPSGDGQLSILHPREMVLPAHISKSVQDMANRGSGSGSNAINMNYSPTIHTGPRSRGGTGLSRSEFQQMMSLHSGTMLGQARNMVRSGYRG